MKRKAVFFDIDGTLYEQGKPVEESAIEAIREIRRKGHLAGIYMPEIPVIFKIVYHFLIIINIFRSL